MIRLTVFVHLVLFALVTAATSAGSEEKAVPATPDRQSVFMGEMGKLVYKADAEGNTVPDFSYCGYRAGVAALPNLPVQLTLNPGEGDDGARIQAALDQVSRLPPGPGGFRGTVLLTRGEYRIAGSISIRTGGVVLRGEGQNEEGTVLIATGTKRRSLIQVGGQGHRQEVEGSRSALAVEYVPVGSRTIDLAAPAPLEVGDHIIVFRPATAAWIHELGMDRLPPRKDGQPIGQWIEGSQELYFDRIVVALAGQRVALDVPLTCALEQKFGGGTIWKYSFPARISDVGVENLRGISEYNGDTDEKHAWTFIELGAAENAWVREVTAVHFGYSAVRVDAEAKWVTVQDCSCLDPVSLITGGRRYSFNISGGQLVLVQRCHARNGRHDFVTGARVAGPNVFLDCTAEKTHSDAGPHHRWAVGVLYDNVSTDGDLNVQNRGNMGTGHGWAGANHVFWNCKARKIICQRPPTANNWAIGCLAESHAGNGTWESNGTNVQPVSLYRAQLAERRGSRD